jgi:hypothetical protein
MKKFILAAILAATLGTAQAAVHFNGLVGATNLGGVGGPAHTNSLVCNIWIKPMKEETMTIIQAVNPLSYHESFGILTLLHGNEMRMTLSLFSPTGGSFDVLSQDRITPGEWHQIGFVLDTDLAIVAYIQDSFLRPPDPDGTLFSGQTGWQFDVAGQIWRVGAAYTNSDGMNIPLLMIGGKPYGTATEPFFGDMEQLVCHFYDTAYLERAMVGNLGNGFIDVYISNGVPVAIGPVDVGPRCDTPFPLAAFLPPICMQESPLNFVTNQGGASAFTEFGGVITPATSSPFDAWYP